MGSWYNISMIKAVNFEDEILNNEAAILALFQRDYHPGIHTAFYTDEPYPHDHRRYIETVNDMEFECFLLNDGQIAFREFREVSQWI